MYQEIIKILKEAMQVYCYLVMDDAAREPFRALWTFLGSLDGYECLLGRGVL